MVVRILGNKFKFCKLYDDDVFGTLTIRPKSNHKILNIIYTDLLKRNFFYKVLKRKLRKFVRKITYVFKKFWQFWRFKFKKRIKRKTKLKNNSTSFLKVKKFYRNRTFFTFKFKLNKFNIEDFSGSFTFFNKFKELKNLKYLNLYIFLYLIKKIKEKRITTIGLLFFKRPVFEKFNYRLDIGKPNRKKKRLTLFCIRLLTRHRLRYFSSRMTKRQFRSYVKKHRNSKFFGTFFIWMLESRIDTILYRLNMQPSAFKGRQFIKHKGLLINNCFVNIPSYRIGYFDILSIINKKEIYEFLLFKFFKKLIFMSIPIYYEFNHRILSLKFILRPRKETIFFPFKLEIGRLGGSGERF
jgi:small subunit ribosomal protein S4